MSIILVQPTTHMCYRITMRIAAWHRYFRLQRHRKMWKAYLQMCAYAAGQGAVDATPVRAREAARRRSEVSPGECLLARSSRRCSEAADLSGLCLGWLLYRHGDATRARLIRPESSATVRVFCLDFPSSHRAGVRVRAVDEASRSLSLLFASCCSCIFSSRTVCRFG